MILLSPCHKYTETWDSLGNLPKVTQQMSDGAEIQVCPPSWSVLSPVAALKQHGRSDDFVFIPLI